MPRRCCCDCVDYTAVIMAAMNDGTAYTVRSGLPEAYSIDFRLRGQSTITAGGHTLTVDVTTGTMSLDGNATEIVIPRMRSSSFEIDVSLYVTPAYALAVANSPLYLTGGEALVDSIMSATQIVDQAATAAPIAFTNTGGAGSGAVDQYRYRDQTVTFDGALYDPPTVDCTNTLFIGASYDFTRRHDPRYTTESATSATIAAITVYPGVALTNEPFDFDNIFGGGTIEIANTSMENRTGGGSLEYLLTLEQGFFKPDASSGDPYPKLQTRTFMRLVYDPDNTAEEETIFADVNASGVPTGTIIIDFLQSGFIPPKVPTVRFDY